MKLLTNSKRPSSNPLQRLRSGHFNHGNVYRNPPVILKYHFSGSRLGHVNLRGFLFHKMKGGHWRKSTNDREGSWYRNYDVAS
jgi:hypothetical protein